MPTVREHALAALITPDANLKASIVRNLDLTAYDIGASDEVKELEGIPGRPSKPELISHTLMKQRSMASLEGRAAMVHALAHIELNAIDLALDLVWRFPNMPDMFYSQWFAVAQEEALHFELLRDHLQVLGFAYGDFPAHMALWEMAEKTKHDLLARIAIVPRTLEARGLDASPVVKAKLVGAGDKRAGEILDIILRDEIGHVKLGNYWFNLMCKERELEPISTYAELAQKYQAPKARGPFNTKARLEAGFTEDELLALLK